LGGRGRRISEFKASLVYRVSSRTARAIQRNPVSKKKNCFVGLGGGTRAQDWKRREQVGVRGPESPDRKCPGGRGWGPEMKRGCSRE
jgi:hypothetical protein